MLYFCFMGVVLAIDYGAKRSGIAVTDNLKMIAYPLDTVGTPELVEFLMNYSLKEEVDLFVGEIKHLYHLQIFLRRLALLVY